MSDISFGESVNVSLGAAATMVEVISLLERLLARQNGQPLPSSLSDMRNGLKDCITRAGANAGVSTKALSAHGDLGFEQDVNAAAEALGITPAGVRWALRTGRLGGRKVGRNWLISVEEIEMYRNTYQRAVS
jgi:Helix-turn-helix domain